MVRGWGRGAWICWAVIAAASARAQDLPDAGASPPPPPPAAAPVDISDLDLDALLETDVRAITVTAVSKKAERAGDAPATVTVLSHDDFVRHDWRNVAEALRSVPGVYVSYGRDYYYTGVRGLSFPTDADSRILVLLDGHPLNNPWSSQSQTSELFTLPPGAIDRVEVIRGPSSSVYGTNAFFAVVNIVSRAPAEKAPGHLSARVAAETTGSLRAELSGQRRSGELQVSAYAVALGGPGPDVDFGDTITRPRLNLGAPTPSGGLATGTDSETGYNLGGLLRYGRFSLQVQWMERLKGLPAAPGDAIFNDPYNSVKDHHAFAELRWQQPIPSGTLELKGSYDRFRSRQYLHRDPTDWPADTWLTGDPHVVSEGNDDSLTAGAQLSWQAVPSVFLVGGVELAGHAITQPTYEVNLLDGAPAPGTLSGGVRGVNGRLRPILLLDAALYAQMEWRPSPSLGVVAGGRFDYNSLFSGGQGLLQQIAPRVAVVYSPRDLLTLKATYGEAFRNPTIYEAYFDDKATACGNPDALPERQRTAELGATLHLPSGLNATASTYLMGLENLLVRTHLLSCYPGSGPRDRFTNLGRGRVIGGEASVDYRSAGASGFLSFSINQVEENVLGAISTPPNSPLAVASAGVAVPFLQQRLWASARAHFVSERLTWRLEDAPPEPAHLLLEVSAVAPRLPGGLKAGLTVLNVLNARWRDPVTSSETIPLAVPQDGVELRAHVGLDF
ncbi:MAG TPA: TonB-dependent receptor [Myxococcales bacterium]|nr:TonB-dependent receptor [Myxococcales bacterium]